MCVTVKIKKQKPIDEKSERAREELPETRRTLAHTKKM